MKLLKKFEGWSQDQISEAIEKSLRIQDLKDSLNPMIGISPYY